jgi:23S rRNA (pseudouridine1915-N3)-methyltransferase
MKISICVNVKKLQRFYLDAVREYEKRLGPYCRVKLITYMSESELPKKLSGAYIIRVAIGVDMVTSEGFAEKISNCAVSGISNLAFVIGSCSDPDNSIGFTYMAAEPGLLAVIVYEQIYRAFCIMNNQPYHK